MRRIIHLIVGCFLMNSLIAQSNNDFFQDTIQRGEVNLGGNYSFGSDAINNEFLNKFIFGGKIEQELKEKVYPNLSSHNRMGGDINFGVNVIIPFDTLFKRTNLSLIVGIEHKEHFDANFTEDLFRFTFDGNKQFAGEFAEIGGTNFNYYNYQQFNFGVVSKKVDGKKVARKGVIVSLIKGQSHQAITIPRGSLFTEEFGRDLTLDLNYIYTASDTSNTGFLAFNGYGVATELFTDLLLKNGDKIHLGVKDIGFIVFDNKSIERIADSTFYFEGIEVDNIFDLNDSLLSDISQDSIVNNITTNKEGDYSIALPLAINVNYTKEISQRWKFNFGVYHKILSNYFPLIYTNTYYYINTGLAVKAHISYGGYGKLNTGLALAKSVNDYFDIFIGTNNLDAFIVPSSSYSNSGFAGIKAYF